MKRALALVAFFSFPLAAASLKIDISAPEQLDANNIAVIRFSVTNTTDTPLNDVTVRLFLGTQTFATSISGDGWSCDQIQSRCTIATLAPHETRTFSAPTIYPRHEMWTPIEAGASTPRGDFGSASITAVFYRDFDVVNVDDGGAGSLRQAIIDANSQCASTTEPIPCRIIFRIAAPVPDDDSFIVTPRSPLPEIVVPSISVDAEAQKALVILSGQAAGPTDGLRFNSSQVVVRGIAIFGFEGSALFIHYRPVAIPSSDPMSHIERNAFVANGSRGVMADDLYGSIENNHISSNGRSAIFLSTWQGGTIANNELSGNGASGIFVGSKGGSLAHSFVRDNVIARNHDFGVALGKRANVAVLQNTFRQNGGGAIDVGLDGRSRGHVPFDDVTDYLDVAVPVITSARYDVASGDTIVEGTAVPSAGTRTSTVFVYANSAADPAGLVEGEELLGSVNLGSSGQFTLRVHRDLRGKLIDAFTSVTVVVYGEIPEKNSSEFGDAVPVTQ